MTLNVAPGLALPDSIVVEKQAILAMSGAGKSNTAVVMAEAMYDRGLPWVVVDGKGDWWGIRSGRDGKAAGLPVPIFGGIHGDVPLEPTAGALIANLIAARRLTCVLDVSEFDTRQQLFRFLADFAETLLKRNTEPLHVFAEEADDYLPQRTAEKGELPRCLGAWQRLVKRGRQRGIGSTLITQRSSAINKDVLNMTDTLIVMRTTAPLDRKAITGWVETHDGHVDLVDSLPSLADGEAWVWSPQKLKLTKRVTFSRRRTYDSGATPLLDSKAKVATLADVDLGALREEMADTIERVQADDPALLRKRIRTLEAELRKRPTETVVEEREVIVEVPAISPETLERLEELLSPGAGLLGEVQETILKLRMEAEDRLTERRQRAPVPTKRATVEPVTPAPPKRGGYVTRAETRAIKGLVDVGKGPSTILGVLRTHGGTMRKDRLRLLTGQAKSTFDRYMVTLRGADLVTDGNPVILTDAGAAVAPDGEVMPPPGDGLFAWWCAHPKVGTGPRSILVALRAAGGEANKFTLRETVGQAKSTFDRYLVTLRGLGIVTGAGLTVSLDDDLR